MLSPFSSTYERRCLPVSITMVPGEYHSYATGGNRTAGVGSFAGEARAFVKLSRSSGVFRAAEADRSGTSTHRAVTTAISRNRKNRMIGLPRERMCTIGNAMHSHHCVSVPVCCQPQKRDTCG